MKLKYDTFECDVSVKSIPTTPETNLITHIQNTQDIDPLFQFIGKCYDLSVDPLCNKPIDPITLYLDNYQFNECWPLSINFGCCGDDFIEVTWKFNSVKS